MQLVTSIGELDFPPRENIVTQRPDSLEQLHQYTSVRWNFRYAKEWGRLDDVNFFP